jgi:hypothetical protein
MSEFQRGNSKLTNRRFHGRIICKDDQEFIKTRTPHDTYNNNQYLVHLPELMPLTADQDEKHSAIWCYLTSGINGYRITPSDARRPKDSNGTYGTGLYGSYMPLHPNTFVEVYFKDENMNDGWITNILSNQSDENCVPFNHDLVDKDDVYLFYRTPRWDNITALFEETKSLPYNSHHFYFNIENEDSSIKPERFGGTDDNTLPQTPIRTCVIVNTSKLSMDGEEEVDNGGIHFYTHDNVYGTIDENVHLAINRNLNLNVREDAYIHLRAFGKENITRATIDQNIEIYQRQHEEEYKADAGGSLPAKNDNPASSDRLNKFTKITLDADVDVHVTNKSKNKSVKMLFDTTLDFINLDKAKIWFKNKLDLIVNLATKIHLKNSLDIVVDKAVKGILKEKLDLTVNQVVKSYFKEKFDITVGNDMNGWIQGKTELVSDDNVALSFRKQLDAMIEESAKIEVRNTFDMIVKEAAKIATQETLDLLAKQDIKIESTSGDIKATSKNINTYSKEKTGLVSDSTFTVESTGSNVIVHAPGGSIILKSSTGVQVI